MFFRKPVEMTFEQLLYICESVFTSLSKNPSSNVKGFNEGCSRWWKINHILDIVTDLQI